MGREPNDHEMKHAVAIAQAFFTEEFQELLSISTRYVKEHDRMNNVTELTDRFEEIITERELAPSEMILAAVNIILSAVVHSSIMVAKDERSETTFDDITKNFTKKGTDGTVN